MIKILLPFVCAFFLFFVGIEAQDASTIKSSSDIFGGGFVGESTLPDYTGGEKKGGAGMFRGIGEILFEFLNRLMVIVAIGFLTWGGVKLLISRGSDDAAFDQRKKEMFAVASGFLVFLVGKFSVDYVFFGDGGWLSGTEEEGVYDAKTFAQEGWIQLEGIFDYTTSFVIAIAVLYMVVTAFQLVLAFGNEEAGTKMKNRLIYTTLGIVLVTSIKQVVLLFTGGGRYQPLGNIDSTGIIKFFVDWANVIIGVLGLIAVLALIWAGFILIAGFGSENTKETAKKIVIYVIVGLVLLLSSWTIIYFVGSGAADS